MEIKLKICLCCAAVTILGFQAEVRADRQSTVIFELSDPLPQSKNFNWYNRGTRRQHGGHQVMWEPLFLLDYNTGKLEPWLGLMIEPNPSHDEWTLTLREGVLWSDEEEPFDAEDVVFTTQMVIDNHSLPAFEASTMRSQVESVTSSDAQTVIFKLRKPNPRFAIQNFGATLFSSFLIMPEHVWKDKDPLTFDFNPPIGTGPYKLESAESDKMTWVRDDEWWGVEELKEELPKPEKLIWLLVDGDDAIGKTPIEESKELLSKDELDAARQYSLQDYKDVDANPNIIDWDPDSDMAWNDPCPRQLEINTKIKPWDKPKLRKALSLLIDRTALVENAYDNTTAVSKTMFTQYGALEQYIDLVVGEDLGVSENQHLDDANDLLKEEGYEKVSDMYTHTGTKQVLSTTILVIKDREDDVRAVTELQSQLLAAGIKTEVDQQTNQEYWADSVPKGDYTMAFGWLSCGSVSEPYSSMSRYDAAKSVPIGNRSPGFANTGRWDSEAAKEYSKIVKNIGLKDLDDTEIPSLVVSAYRVLAEEMPFIPLVQSPRIIPFNTKYWTGWPDAKDSYNPPMHSWSSTHRVIHNLRAVE